MNRSDNMRAREREIGANYHRRQKYIHIEIWGKEKFEKDENNELRFIG